MFLMFLGVSYVCLQVFQLDVAHVCNDFQVFSGFLASVSDVYFKCFICLLLYIASVAFGCSKVDRVLRVGSARQHGPTVGMLAANSTC
jgi:hypothetical protein